MAEHALGEIMTVTLDKLRGMVDVNTIIGTPITTPDGTTIIPVSKVTFGFASGGSDFGSKKEEEPNKFGGGSGAGVTIIPIAFLAVSGGSVEVLPVAPPPSTSGDRMVEMVPDVIDKITALFKKKKEKAEPETTEE